MPGKPHYSETLGLQDSRKEGYLLFTDATIGLLYIGVIAIGLLYIGITGTIAIAGDGQGFITDIKKALL